MIISQTRRRHVAIDNAIRSISWPWGNWIKNQFRKASEIDFTRNGVCATHQLNTARGVIFCCVSQSPYAIHRMRNLIARLYRESGEEPPIFVTIRVFRRIQEIENG